MSRQTILIAGKWILGLAILVLVGRQFAQDLSRPEIQDIAFHPGWLAASAVLYLAGLTTWGLYWYRLMRLFDQDLRLATAMRAYFLGQFGKYVPGKAWALLLRADQAAGPGVAFGVTVVTAFYEVLTSMAAGALIAAVVFYLDPPSELFRGLDFPPHLTGLILLACCGVPLLPGVFNYLAGRMARRFSSLETFQIPKMRLPVLLQGIALTGLGWSLMGLSVWACLASVMDVPPLTVGTWAYDTAIVGLAYVLGFVAIVLPSGVGVREWVLSKFLMYAGPAPIIVAAVLLLRLAWTVGEIVLAAILWALVRRSPANPRCSGDAPPVK